MLFSKQNLICCICGISYQASVNTTWHSFAQAVCSEKCYTEKEWRKVLSIMGQPYKPNPGIKV